MDFDFLLRGHQGHFKARANALKEQTKSGANVGEAQRLIDLHKAYHNAFSTKEGRAVLTDMFRNMDNTIMMGMALKEEGTDPKMLYDEGRANILEGRRRVLNEILDSIRIGEFL